MSLSSSSETVDMSDRKVFNRAVGHDNSNGGNGVGSAFGAGDTMIDWTHGPFANLQLNHSHDVTHFSYMKKKARNNTRDRCTNRSDVSPFSNDDDDNRVALAQLLPQRFLCFC